MEKVKFKIKDIEIPLYTTDVAVVGSGAAALNGAIHLKKSGVKNVTIVTQKSGGGTSANAGSDKQTYYRVNPTGLVSDSAMEMAQDLFNGNCMHGDIALVESTLSTRSFYHLVEAGVPFPQDHYGNYVGFRTDHDLKSRGTSAGPRTSIQMFQKLLEEAKKLDVQILDNCHVTDLLTITKDDQKRVVGLLGLDKNENLVAIKADYVIYGTGGPGALYSDSVYPQSQIGALGTPLKAGAKAQNLTESQFGIASRGFRWNLSGSYQQVLPRYISTKPDGSDSKEFLNIHFPTGESLLTAQFLKGYQWPFDVKKVADFGSSMIDLLVYQETVVKGRVVYLDYTINPSFPDFDFNMENLPKIVKEYLIKSGATGKSPIDRLIEMNSPAYELYNENGIDLKKDKLKIAVCHQHCNGGLAGSVWWESNIKNFFPVGECNGTHGIYRPGGSALNSGQVGSMRAAEMIGFRCENEESVGMEDFINSQKSFVEKQLNYLDSLASKKVLCDPVKEREVIQKRMSSLMGIIRNPEAVEKGIEENRLMMADHFKSGLLADNSRIFFLQNEDLLITERAFLESARKLHQTLKGGRGSYLVGDVTKISSQSEEVEEKAKNIDVTTDDSLNNFTIEYWLDSNKNHNTQLVPVRPIPSESTWFEKVWGEFRENKRFKSEEK